MDFKLERVLDEKGFFKYYDVVIKNGKIETISGIDEIRQRVIIALSIHRGELFQNEEFGVDYTKNVMGRSTDDPVMIAEFTRVILSVTGVTGLSNLLLKRQTGTRILSLSAQITTTQGNIDLATELAA